MPVPHHDPLEFVAGDDWDIGGTLLRPDGTAYDLTNASVTWMLRGPDGAPALQDDQYAIKFSSPPTAGLLVIAVTATATATLRPGRYLDWLRATDSAGTDVLDRDHRGLPQTRGAHKTSKRAACSANIINGPAVAGSPRIGVDPMVAAVIALLGGVALGYGVAVLLR